MMETKYDFLPYPPQKDGDEPQAYYPKIVSKGTVPFEKLAHQIAESSTFKEGTVLGVMEELEHWMSYYLSQGYRVELGRIGVASVKLRAEREVTDKAAIHAQSVRFDKVNFTVSKHFSGCCHGTLARAETHRKFRQSSTKYAPEERFNLLCAYLKEHPYITLTEYGLLTGLQKTKAWRDMAAWVKAGKVTTKGRAPHRVYVLEEQAV